MSIPLSSAPAVIRAAREDSGMTQRALADAVGSRQPHIAGIEAGQRSVSVELLARLLEAADYRPSLSLAAHRDELLALGARRSIEDIRVFGSVARGSDHHHSDVDLLVRILPDADPLSYALFVEDAARLLGFPVDVVVEDENTPEHIRRTAVPL